MKDPAIYLQQRALQSMGFYNGSLDGDEGPLTRTAYFEWMATLDEDSEAGTFHDLVKTWNLRHITADELLAKGGSNARLRLNTDPPRNLWPNIKAAALAADEARHRLGSGILITSAYRSPAYNKAIGGESKSYHMQFRALDLIPVNGAVALLHKILKELRQEGFQGAQGIGRYPSFCHTDNGPRRDW